ncbi:hypothetical protein [Henriciella aquimarina]|uniref:hypothetical protein n=1 Tax=Henriciella aquimarina TaxID=545261 RepID=UPI0009FE3F73|nr:hypothetical protein [Henriciella aquimarina]
MASWIITLSVITALTGMIVFANRKMGGMRKDGRPNQVPWGLVMVMCVLGIFIAFVHAINLAGFETGPEHGLLGRFGR